MGNQESRSPTKDTTNEDSTKRTKSETKTSSRTFKEPEGSADTNVKDTNKSKHIVSENKKVDKNTRLAFEDWLFKRLTQYFTDIQENILELSVDKAERCDIESAVREFLGFLCTELEIVDRRFHIKPQDVIGVGTFYEQTEIVTVDRLEYCVVIDDISKDNIGFINQVHEDGDEVLKVDLTENCSRRWEECVLNEGLDKHWLQADPGLLTMFLDVVTKAVNNVRSKSRGIIYRKLGRLDLLEEKCVNKVKSSVELKFTWNIDSIVTVSLTPCLRYDVMKEFISDTTTPNKRVAKIFNTEQKLLLHPVPETIDHFRWHFGHVEKVLMNDKALQIHKMVYKLIIFFIHGYNQTIIEDAELFTESVIKTLVLYHHENCGTDNRLADCVMAVIDDMRKLLKEFLGNKSLLICASFIHRPQNVLSSACRHVSESVIQMNLDGLEQIANHLINEIGCTPLYDFTTDIKKLVPLNAYILHDDYRARKHRGNKKEDQLEANRTLIDAVGNNKFAVQIS